MNGSGRLAHFLRWAEHIDVYIAAFLAALVAALAAFDVVDAKAISTLTMTVLALVALSMLSGRRSTAELKNTVSALNAHLTDLQAQCTASDVLSHAYPDVASQIRRAKRVRIVGTTLTPTAARYLSDFEELLRKGGVLEVVVSKPSLDVLAMQQFRSSSTKDAAVLRGIVEGNIAMLASLAPVGGDRLLLRQVPYLVSYGLLMINGGTATEGGDVAYVKLLPFRRPDSEAPTIMISALADDSWFAFFDEQFALLWQASAPFEPPAA